MKRLSSIIVIITILLFFMADAFAIKKYINLPKPQTKGKVSVELAIRRRRSVRTFKKGTELSREQISQLLYAGQGITSRFPTFRAAPSAGATYPLELFIVMEDGVYHYVPKKHRLIETNRNDLRFELSKAAMGQSSIIKAPASIVICGIYERTSRKYGRRAARYVHMEVGHVAQNILLQATALGLGGVTVGAFNDGEVKSLLNLSKQLEPLMIIPIGHPK